jgi:hypothetical protein
MRRKKADVENRGLYDAGKINGGGFAAKVFLRSA